MNNKQVKKLKRLAKVFASANNGNVDESFKRLKTVYKENKKNGKTK
jgi:hypothetical protein